MRCLRQHADRLADAGYVDKRRALTSDGFRTKRKATDAGPAAFEGYVEALAALLGPNRL